MDSITKRQLEYINILSSYQFTTKEDKADIDAYIKSCQKNTIEELTKKEGSELIQILLKRPKEYIFICGKSKILDKKEVNCFNVLGEMEACIHDCPVGIDINDCPDFEKWYNKESDTERP